MPLAVDGFLSFGGNVETRSFNLELGKEANAEVALNDQDVRFLARIGTANAEISVFDFYGKSYFEFGEQEYVLPGDYVWVCPANVTSISVVCVGAGGGGHAGSDILPIGSAGGGGALAYRNNINVIPGQSYNVTVGAAGLGHVKVDGVEVQAATNGNATIAFSCIAGGGEAGRSYDANVDFGPGENVVLYSNGGTVLGVADGGGSGGRGGLPSFIASGGRVPGGGGAGGYTGVGGDGAAGKQQEGQFPTGPGEAGQPGNGGGGGGGGSGYLDNNIRANVGGSGGGVGLYGQTTSGNGGLGGSQSFNRQNGRDGSTATVLQYHNGGGGGAGSGALNRYAANGFPGAVRIIWPGRVRRFPNSQTSQNA
jgi:hypothetical protein